MRKSSKLGIRIPFISPLIAKFKTARAERALDHVTDKMKSLCRKAEQAKESIESARKTATNIDSAFWRDKADDLKKRYDAELAPACEELREAKEPKTAATKREEVKKDLRAQCKEVIYKSAKPGKAMTGGEGDLKPIINACAAGGGKITIPAKLHPSGKDTDVSI